MAARKPSTRADQLRVVGENALAHYPGAVTDAERAVVKAVAAMLAVVELPRGRRAKPGADVKPLAFSPNQLYQELLTRVPHLVICEPVQFRLFGFLGAQLRGIGGLEAADCERVVSWIEAGGLSSWTVQPVFAHVVQNIAKFIGYARVWDQRGRQQLTKGKSNVGLPVAQASESDLAGDFR